MTFGGTQDDSNNDVGYPEPDTPTNNETETPTNTESADDTRILKIVTNKDDSFYLVNIGQAGIPLGLLRFEEGNKDFEGGEWGVDSLAPGQCVSVWKDRGNPDPPDIDCNEVGTRIEREPKEAFWKKSFDIFFQDELISSCPKEGCEFTVPKL
jgi:hypothetical protein